MKYRMIDALKSKYEAAYKEASTTLEIYLTKPAAIGEHPQHFEEMDKLISAMADAQDKIDTLKKEFPRINPELLNE
jgi:hypothetical protein